MIRTLVITTTVLAASSAFAAPFAIYDITAECDPAVAVAVPNDGLDDAPSIQACVDKLKADGGGVLYIPPGVFTVGFATHDKCDGSDACSINIVGLENVEIRGDGPSSIIRKSGAGSGGDWYTWKGGANENLSFRDFVSDGNSFGVQSGAITNVGEQTHEFQFSISTHGDARRISFDRMRVLHSHGDGIRTVGSQTYVAEGFKVTNSWFIDNKRGGIGVQRGSVGFTIHGNHFWGGTDQCIDFEPSSYGDVNSFSIVGNNILCTNDLAVTLSGGSLAPHGRSVFSGNVVTGGVYMYENHDLVVSDNVIWSSPNTTYPALEIKKGQDGIVVQGNVLIRSGSSNGPVLRAVHHNSGFASALLIANNRILQNTTGPGIDIQTAKRAIVTGNLVRYTGTASPPGINLRSYSQVAEAWTVSGNTVTGPWLNGVQISSADSDIDALTIANNSIKGSGTGIKMYLGTGAYTVPPMITGNAIDATGSAILFAQETYAIGGNSGSHVHLVGYGVPPSVIGCVVGSLYTDSTDTGGVSLYICKSSGWAPL